MPKNNAIIPSILSAVMTAAGICLFAASFFIRNSAGMTEAGLLLTVIFGICFAVCVPRARHIDRIFKGEGLLAHWRYTDAEVKEYSERECRERKKSNLSMLIVITAVLAVLTALVVLLYYGNVEKASGLITAIVGVLALLWLAAFLSPVRAGNRMQNGSKEAFIGAEGAWVFGDFVLWKTRRTRLSEIKPESGEQGTMHILIRYLITQRYGNTQHTFRIPVPQGMEADAARVMEHIRSANGL